MGEEAKVRSLFFGPPGSGKGTQAARFASARGLPHVSSGDLLRAAVASGSAIGREAKGFMDRGELVPDRLVLDLLFERLAGRDCASGFVLDGFPRTVGQAESVEARLGRGLTPALDLALRFALSDEALVERMSGRRSCARCGLTYHVRWNPPRSEGRCDRCGGELVRRLDDDPSVVRERLRVHRRDEAGLVDLYRRLGILRELDAGGSIDAVARALSAIAASLPAAQTTD